MATYRPIRTPWREKVRDMRTGPLTVVVWLAVLAAVVFLLASRGSRLEYVGLARALQYEVSTAVTGRLASVPVDLYDHVEAGQVLALLDGAGLEARLATAAAELRRLQGELKAEAARNTVHAADVTGELRRFLVDEERLRLELLALRVELESDRVERERLELRAERNLKLLQEGLIARTEYDDTRLRRDALARRIEENEILLARTGEEYRQAGENFERRFATADSADPVLQPLQDAIRVQALRIEELEVERRSLVLRSPVDGSVQLILASPGQAVVPGEPLLTIADVVATEVLAYLPEQAGNVPEVQDVALVAKQGSPGGTVEGLVDRIGPAVEQMPQRLWRDPAVPEYGRPVAVRGVSRLGLIPGQQVTVSIEP
jgi:multidrug resistance efflux pump